MARPLMPRLKKKSGNWQQARRSWPVCGSRHRLSLVAAREEVAVLQNRLTEESRQLAEAQELNKKLPVLEKTIADRQDSLARVQEEKEELVKVVDGLKARIDEERKAFEDGLVYVQGSHYLPASVVRNLTSRQEMAAEPVEEEEDV